MTRRRDLERHRHSLGEIRDIMNSMKTLAYMETRKLARFLDAQINVVESIEEVATDFLGFHADTLPKVNEPTPVYLLIGTERGFCGDFNQALVHHLESTTHTQPAGKPILIAIGRKLRALLDSDTRVDTFVDGASTVEEVTVVLNRMVYEISFLQEQYGMLAVYVLYHGGNNGVVTQKLLPPFQYQLHQPLHYSHPPLLHLPPSTFLVELTEQYLFAALYAILYSSLMAENHNRVTHLEGAVRDLDDHSEELARQCSAMRQEEIIEEIEVILLSTANLSEEQGKRKHKNGIR